MPTCMRVCSINGCVHLCLYICMHVCIDIRVYAIAYIPAI